MALTPAQIATLAAHWDASEDATLVAAKTSGDNNVVVAWYNTQAAPDFWVLKSSVSVDAIVSAMDWGTDYAAFKDDMPAIAFLLQNGTYDPRQPNSRNALNEVFSAAAATKAAVLVEATRLATEVEKLFAVSTTGPGGGDGSSQGNSAIAVFEGNVVLQDIRDARELLT